MAGDRPAFQSIAHSGHLHPVQRAAGGLPAHRIDGGGRAGQGSLRPRLQDAIRRAGSDSRPGHLPEARQELPGRAQALHAADAGAAGRNLCPALHAHLASDVRRGRRHSGASGGRVLDRAQPRLLRLVLVLRADLSSGAHCDLAQSRIGARRGQTADQAAPLQGLHTRCGRPDRQLPPPGLQESADARRVQGQAVPVPSALQKPGRGSRGLYQTPERGALAARREEGIRAQRRAVRLRAGRQGAEVPARAGQASRLRSAQGRAGARVPPRAALHGQARGVGLRGVRAPLQRGERKGGAQAVPRALLHVLASRLHTQGRDRAGAVHQAERTPSRAGAGLLPHPWHAVHRHVLHRPRPARHEAGLRAQGSPREGHAARAHAVLHSRQPAARARGAPPRRPH